MSRSDEFNDGSGRHAKVIEPNYFVEKRYGDRKQIPTNGPRRGGPLPYPLTREEHDWLERDKWWSHSE